MRRIGRLRSWLWALSGVLAFSISNNFAQSENDELNVKIIIFTDEFEEFISTAWEVYNEGPTLKQEELQKKIETLIENANRIAVAYFEAIDSDIRPEMEAYLSEQYRKNSEIHHYFLLLGNAVYNKANSLVENQKNEHQKLRKWGTVGGTLVGMATGGAILYFKSQVASGALKATLLVLGLSAAGAAVGYGGAYLTHSFILPADPAVINAEDFLLKYPSGLDFITDIRNANSDLALGLLDLEEVVNGTGSL